VTIHLRVSDNAGLFSKFIRLVGEVFALLRRGVLVSRHLRFKLLVFAKFLAVALETGWLPFGQFLAITESETEFRKKLATIHTCLFES
jgi:hypothetical protein